MVSIGGHAGRGERFGAAGRRLVLIGALIAGSAVVSSPAQAAAGPHYTRGILTRTVYFNHAETRRIASSAQGAADFARTLRSPYSGLIGTFSHQFAAYAVRVDASGYCLKLRSTGSLGYYSGSAGDGYCR